jgi:hypothetical protein
MHPYPQPRMNELFQHPLLARLSVQGLDLLHRDTWPEPDDWNAQAPFFPDLRFAPEIRPGSRRRRKEKKEARSRPGLRSYEAQIFEAARIPTRLGHPHDFFNAMMWLSYPQSKLELHRKAYCLQKDSEALASPNRRSPLIDRLTCFDEGGVFFVLDAQLDDKAIEDLLGSRLDHEKFRLIQRYRTDFHVFGHGLLECLLNGQIDLNVSCLILPTLTTSLSLDEHLRAGIKSLEAESNNFGTIPFRALWDCIG